MQPLVQSSSRLCENPVEILQDLIRFNTTNPPGNEAACIHFIAGLLNSVGIDSVLIERTPGRPNLIARIKGNGNAAPLLLYGHVDVVTTEGQKWTYPPFEARLVDGFVWGRGALDMKHGIAMYLAALLKARGENASLPGDIIFAATVDEEDTCNDGAKFLVEKHPDLFDGVKYALSEFGGASMIIGGKRFYPIQTSEKQVCAVKITFSGEGGHGAIPVHGGAMAKLSRALGTLDSRSLPVHITQPAREMIEALAQGMGGITGMVMKQVLHPPLTDGLLNVMGQNGKTFSPLLHNSVSPTILKASEKRNVIPTEVTLILDGRLLPGFDSNCLENELRALLGKDCLIEVFMPDPGPVTTDMSLYPLLARTIMELDPGGIPVPFLNFAVTDARFFSKLGIQTYGFTPLQLPADLSLTRSIHNVDERVPVAALDFGVKAVSQVIRNFK